MKHTPFIFLAVAAHLLALNQSSALGQGTIVFANDDRGLIRKWVRPSDPTEIVAPKGGAFVQIAYAPVGTPSNYGGEMLQSTWLRLSPGWTLGPVTDLIDPGRFNGGTVSLTGIPAGADADYLIFGWTPGGGIASFDEALLSGYSLYQVSDIFVTPTGSAAGPGVSLADTFKGMTLGGTIPEPNGIALSVLGIGLLIAFRKGVTH